jgi:hypothetical protein
MQRVVEQLQPIRLELNYCPDSEITFICSKTYPRLPFTIVYSILDCSRHGVVFQRACHLRFTLSGNFGDGFWGFRDL